MSTRQNLSINSANVTNRLQAFQPTIARPPLVTLMLSAIAVALSFWGWGIDHLTYDRAAIAAGDFWRLLAGHLVHWNLDHMFWDTVMFATLGAMIERRSRGAFVGVLALSASAIWAVLWFCQVDLVQYRGLSGIDSGLFAFIAVTMFGESWREGRTLLAGAVVALAVGFVGKIAFELVTGQTLFVDSAAAGFTPLPLVHAVGGLAGIVMCLMRAKPRRVPQRDVVGTLGLGTASRTVVAPTAR